MQVNLKGEPINKKLLFDSRADQSAVLVFVHEEDFGKFEQLINLDEFKRNNYSEVIADIKPDQQQSLSCSDEIYRFLQVRDKLKNVLTLIASGSGEVEPRQIEQYFKIACMFKFSRFVQWIMAKSIKFRYVDIVLMDVFKNHNSYLKSVQGDQYNFVSWFISTHRELSKVSEVNGYFPDRTDLLAFFVDYFEYKTESETIQQEDIQEVIQYFEHESINFSDPQYYKDQIKRLVPWPKVPIALLQDFKYLFTDEEQLRRILLQKIKNQSSQSIRAAGGLKKQIQRKREELSKVIEEKGKLKFKLLIEKLEYRKQPEKQTNYDNDFPALQKSRPNTQIKIKQQSKRNKQEQIDYELALKLSQYDKQEKKPTKKTNVRLVHEIPQCNESDSVLLECLCEVCFFCQLNRCIAKSNYDMTAITYDKIKKYGINCYRCNSLLTANDAKMVQAKR